MNSKQQAQNYLNHIDITSIMAFIVDDYEILKDKNLRSPLIGLYSSFKELRNLNFDYAFILSCDNPFIQKLFIENMIIECSNTDGCVPIWKNSFIEPLLSIYKVRSFYDIIIQNLQKKDFKLSHILDSRNKIQFVSIEDTIKNFDKNLLSFININDKKDIKNLR